MLIKVNSRVDRIQEVINRIRADHAKSAQEAEAERKRRYDEMLGNLTQFLGTDAQPSSDLYQEGLVTRELLALTHENALIYNDGGDDHGNSYLLTHDGKVVVVMNALMGDHEMAEEVMQLDELAGLLVAKGVTFDRVLENVRAKVDAIMDCDLVKDKNTSPASDTLPKQTYPAIGGVATIEGKQFTFPVAAGIGRVMLDGQPALVEFNCPLEAVPPQGTGHVLVRGEVAAKIYDGTPYVVA